MIEVYFYHLTRRTLEQALPVLLEKSLEREWRVAVQAGDEKRLKKLDDFLWSYDPEKFLPHGTKADGAPETQPIYLTVDNDNPNEADVRFFVLGALAAPAILEPGTTPRTRAVLMFDGNDAGELQAAREEWRKLRDAGCEVVYNQEDEAGRWQEKKREKKT
ncbi:DNA polymerase III subunit chi [Methylocystis heyeri]|uniref:DNA polymerase III subunit chi n=1 Tax=Methylocystis heyeri TaxID=391905 RepID=A0A6B8KLC3_9HYPH|nr:DNA polymerase III subunit chi [Methylocystis heyeri]QGM47795.1 DNA polymerase III subunit chi [Methylocystis heyeri]